MWVAPTLALFVFSLTAIGTYSAVSESEPAAMQTAGAGTHWVASPPEPQEEANEASEAQRESEDAEPSEPVAPKDDGEPPALTLHPTRPTEGNVFSPFHPASDDGEPPDPPEGLESAREEIVPKLLARARRFMGKRRPICIDGKCFHYDCANYTRAVYNFLGDIMSYPGGPKTNGGVRRIWYYAKYRGAIHFRKRPAPGDVVFWHLTFDANGNRRPDDWFTHVGVVEKVDDDGTVTYLDRTTDNISRRKMNLFHPNLHRHPGTKKLLNSHVRQGWFRSKKSPQYLSGQLFAGFATLVQ